MKRFVVLFAGLAIFFNAAYAVSINSINPKDCKNLLGGLEKIGWSVDLRFYDPFAASYNSSGLRQKVIDFDCKRMAVESLNNGSVFAVPADSFNIETAKSTQNVHITISSPVDYRFQLAQYFGNLENDVGWFTDSKTYQAMQQFYDNNTITFLISGTKSIRYEAGLYTQDTMIGPDLLTELNSLPRNFNERNQEIFNQHFSKYGTHLIVAVLGGGVSWKVDEIKLCPYHDTLVDPARKAQLRQNLAKIFNRNGNNTARSDYSNSSFKVGGINSTLNEEDWLENLSLKPAAVNIVPQPLYTFVENEDRQKALEEATFSLMVKSELKVQGNILRNLSGKLRSKDRKMYSGKIEQELRKIYELESQLKYSLEDASQVQTLRMEIADIMVDIFN